MVSQFFISFAIKSISSGPQFLKSHKHFCLPVSPTCPTIFFFEKAKIYTFKDVDCKKDHQEGPYLNHLGKKLTIAFKTPSLAAIVYSGAFERRVNFRSLYGYLQRI